MNDSAHEHDVVGHRILEELAPATRLHQWHADTFRPYLGQRVLEIGSGFGNISRQLIDLPDLTLSDTEAEYLEHLRKEFGDTCTVLKIDMDVPDQLEPLRESFDSVIMLNVLEHIRDDKDCIDTLFKVLKPGGTLCILVPQYPALMSNLDRKLSHFRRYTKKDLRNKLEQAGYRVEVMKNLNTPGLVGWYVVNTLMGRENFGSGKLKLFNTLVPLFRAIEAILPLPGLSIVAVARKPV